jgi:hypothetical protein
MLKRSNSQTVGGTRRESGFRCRLASFALLFLMGAIVPGLSFALQVTPSLQFFDLKAGGKDKGEYTLTNETEETVRIVPETKEWFTLPANKENGITVDKWLVIKSTSFPLKPGESRKVKFEIRAPKKATGELVGMVSYLIEGSDKFINKRFSLAVYVNITGTDKPAGEIPAITVDVSSTNLMAGFLLHNTGNVHLRPEGLMQILNAKNEPVANLVIKRSVPAYPGETKPYTGTIANHTLAPGEYSAKITMEDADRGAAIPPVVKKFTVKKDKKVIAK